MENIPYLENFIMPNFEISETEYDNTCASCNFKIKRFIVYSTEDEPRINCINCYERKLKLEHYAKEFWLRRGTTEEKQIKKIQKELEKKELKKR